MSGRELNLIILLVVIPYIVPIILSRIGAKTREYNTSSIDNFIMRPVKAIAYIGIIGGLFSGGMIIFAIYLNQLSAFVGILFGLFFLLSVVMLFVSCPHFWDVYVNGDDIVAYRCFMKWRSDKISNIAYVVQNRGGLHAYDINNHKICSIDGYSNNIENFKQRMNKENIEIRYKSEIAGRDY